MPKMYAEGIRKVCEDVLRKVGASEQNANIVATHLAESNLLGHDSHGIWRIAQYAEEIKENRLDPKGIPEVVNENNAVAQVRGNRTFGQVVSKFSTELAIEKAKIFGIGLVRMYSLAHTGRLGAWTEMAAKQGMAAVMYSGNVGPGGIAPFGGKEGIMSTNPFSMAYPSSSQHPIVLDFATSTGLASKMPEVLSQRYGENSFSEPWIVNKHGKPSSDISELSDGGAILPMGGLSSGHKGYAMSFMVMLFGALIGNLGNSEKTTVNTQQYNGSSIIAIDLSKFLVLEDILEQTDVITDNIKSTPTMEGFDEVLYPGELEYKTSLERKSKGVPISPGPRWDGIIKIVEDCGLYPDLKRYLFP